MVSGGDPHLISVAKYNKYALRGVLGFDAKGGHITYENTYHKCGVLLDCMVLYRRRAEAGGRVAAPRAAHDAHQRQPTCAGPRGQLPQRGCGHPVVAHRSDLADGRPLNGVA